MRPYQIKMFYPNVTKHGALEELESTLSSRWIGEGPKVLKFEEIFIEKFKQPNFVAVNSGTAALDLAYDLAGIKSGDEVVAPVFTCTATNMPLLNRGAKVRFADVGIDGQHLCVTPASILSKVTEWTRAIVVVHLGGYAVDVKEIRKGLPAKLRHIPIIEDAAQALGARYPDGTRVGTSGNFVMYSFQAIKHLTTGDGGGLVLPNPDYVKAARRKRWFGIDRVKKIKADWDPITDEDEMVFDVVEHGYKYHMNDISASIGIANMRVIDKILDKHRSIAGMYNINLKGFQDFKIMPPNPLCSWWTYPLVFKSRELKRKAKLALRDAGIESNVVQVRNDAYTIFGSRRRDLPFMDDIEGRYLYVPMHFHISAKDVQSVTKVLKSEFK